MPAQRTPGARLTPSASLLTSPLFVRHAGCYGDGQRTYETKREDWGWRGSANGPLMDTNHGKAYFVAGGLSHSITFAREASSNCEGNNVS